MVSSVAATVHPAGDRVVSPNGVPVGAWRTIFTRLAFASLAAVSVKKVGWPVGNVFGLISSWARAGAAAPVTRPAARTPAARTERVRIGALLRRGQPPVP